MTIKENVFKTSFAENIFRQKYAQGVNDTWQALARRLVDDVCGKRGNRAKTQLLANDELTQLVEYITDMKFIPGGRYLYYSGRPLSYFNNCFCLRAEEDTREEWGSLANRACSALMSGGGIGVEYSVIRPSGYSLSRTGGISSGPLPLMYMINEVGRNVMQGGSRRSAIYASLNWQHEDMKEFMYAKNWSDDIKMLKEKDFNFPAPLDMTNISINWDDDFEALVSDGQTPNIWYESIKQMLSTGEPGHSYNFGMQRNETLRNACTEITSEDDSDVCNLGSINFANIKDVNELKDVVQLASKFLVCGSIRGDLPYQKVYEVREKNRRIGLGMMGIHEWLLSRGHGYEVTDELRSWLEVYKEYSEKGANDHCDRFFLSRPKGYRAVAPAGTIGILASTTTGIEPLFSVAYKRRYLVLGKKWKYEYVIDATAQRLIEQYGLSPDNIETAYSLSSDYEKRIKFQYEIQKYIDHGISSTINLPSWGSDLNNEDTIKPFGDTLLKYFKGLRGITVYPDGSRGGQPLTEVPYEDAISKTGVVYDENEEKCAGGVCGL